MHARPAPEELVVALQEACAARGARLTGLRREVLLALARAQAPESAYALLARLNRKRAKKLSPMSLYRALDYLIELGFALRIDSTNSYALCAAPAHEAHRHVMIVCDRCGHLDEVHDDTVISALESLSRARGHTVRNHGVEIHGFCATCKA